MNWIFRKDFALILFFGIIFNLGWVHPVRAMPVRAMPVRAMEEERSLLFPTLLEPTQPTEWTELIQKFYQNLPLEERKKALHEKTRLEREINQQTQDFKPHLVKNINMFLIKLQCQSFTSSPLKSECQKESKDFEKKLSELKIKNSKQINLLGYLTQLHQWQQSPMAQELISSTSAFHFKQVLDNSIEFIKNNIQNPRFDEIHQSAVTQSQELLRAHKTLEEALQKNKEPFDLEITPKLILIHDNQRWQNRIQAIQNLFATSDSLATHEIKNLLLSHQNHLQNTQAPLSKKEQEELNKLFTQAYIATTHPQYSWEVVQNFYQAQYEQIKDKIKNPKDHFNPEAGIQYFIQLDQFEKNQNFTHVAHQDLDLWEQQKKLALTTNKNINTIFSKEALLIAHFKEKNKDSAFKLALDEWSTFPERPNLILDQIEKLNSDLNPTLLEFLKHYKTLKSPESQQHWANQLEVTLQHLLSQKPSSDPEKSATLQQIIADFKKNDHMIQEIDKNFQKNSSSLAVISNKKTQLLKEKLQDLRFLDQKSKQEYGAVLSKILSQIASESQKSPKDLMHRVLESLDAIESPTKTEQNLHQDLKNWIQWSSFNFNYKKQQNKLLLKTLETTLMNALNWNQKTNLKPEYKNLILEALYSQSFKNTINPNEMKFTEQDHKIILQSMENKSTTKIIEKNIQLLDEIHKNIEDHAQEQLDKERAFSESRKKQLNTQAPIHPLTRKPNALYPAIEADPENDED